MTTKTYGTGGSIPGDTTTVEPGSTVQQGEAAFNCGLIGGMNVSTGTATPGTVYAVETSGRASALFGEDSELYEQCRLALLNGTDTVYAIAVSETSGSESFSSVSSGTLADAPVFDPRVHDEHDVTITSGETVNIVDGVPTTPSDVDTINFNPLTGDWEADASGTYEFNYTYGDYSTAIDTLTAHRVDEDSVRFIGLCSEDSTYATELLSDLNSIDDDFYFTIGVAGAPAATDSSTYSQSFDDYRLSILAPARGFTDTGETNMVRTIGAVVGYLGGLELGDTSTYDPPNGLAGIESLHTEYTPTQAGQLIDAGVMPLLPLGGATIVKDMTTDSEVKFERIYAVEIADNVAETFHEISQNFVGELRTDENKNSYAESGLTSLKSMRDGTPKLLDAYTLSIQDDPNDDFGVEVEVGVEIVKVIDNITVTVIVGDVVLNGGLN